MKNKKRFVNEKRGRNLIISFAIISLIVLFLLIFLVSALTPQEELSQLESELVDSGYSWLVNYSVDYSQYGSSIEVYLENGNETITTIENVSAEGTYKTYLTGLGDNTEDVFDLKINSLNGIEFDYIVDPDTVFPNVTIVIPTNLSNFNVTLVEINSTIADETGLSTCWYTNNSGATNTTFTCGTNLSLTWPEGNQQVIVYANDTSNNINSSLVNFTIDITSPQINFTYPTPANSSSQTATSVYINISSNDSNGKEHYVVMDWNRSLVLFMPFDVRNSLGNPLDISGYGNNGTKFGNALFNQSGKHGGAMTFDGSGDYVDLGTSTSLEPVNITVCAWVWPNGTQENSAGIVQSKKSGDNGGWVLNTENPVIKANAIKFWIYDGDWQNALSTGAIANRIWTHLCGTFNGSTIRLYIGGILNATGSNGPISYLAATANAKIGQYSTNYDWNGSIDDVMIFNRALSAEEISALYNASATKYVNNFTNLNVGTYNYTAYVVDQGGNINRTETRNVTITAASSDTEYPYFTNYSTTPANNTAYVLNAYYNFSSNVNTTNGSAGVEFNSVNYTAFNSTGNLFNATLYNIKAGDYTYYWWSYGNGTSKNFNSSGTRDYSVARATGLVNLTINATTPQNYGFKLNATCLVKNGDDTNATLRIDGILRTSGSVYDLNASTHTINCSKIISQNYTASENYSNFVINRIASAINVTLNETQNNISINEGGQIRLNVSMLTGELPNYVELYNNGGLINNGSSPLSNLTTFNTLGTFNITGHYNATTNYSESWQTWNVTVNNIDNEYPIFSNYWDNNATLIGNGTALFNVTLLSTNGTVILDINNTNITATNLTASVYNASTQFTIAGNYSYKWYSYGNGTSKNFNTSQVKNYTVNASADTIAPYFNEVLTNQTVAYKTAFSLDVNATDAVGFDSYAVNDTTNFNINSSGWLKNATFLAAGTYRINITINDTTNNKNTSNIQIDVTSLASVVNLTINATTPQNYGTKLNATCNVLTGDNSNSTLWVDGIVRTNSATLDLNASTHTMNCSYVATTNYTGSNNYSSFIINKIVSSINVTVNETANNISINEGGQIRLNVSMLTGELPNYVELYNNGGLINNGSSPLSNLTTFNTLGTFNITGHYNATTNYSESWQTWNVTVNNIDNEYPYFSNYSTTPTNNTAYVLNAYYNFSANVNTTNGSAGVEFNSVNYTAFNSTGNLFNATLYNIKAGDYTYYWWSYGNGTSKNFNSSGTRDYSVARATGLVNLTINATTPQNYGFKLNATCLVKNGDDTNATLRIDGILRTSGSVYDLNASTHTINCSKIISQNYTASENYSNFVISQIMPTGSITNTTSWTINYGTSTTIGLSESNLGDNDLTYTIFKNNVSIGAGETATLAVGTYWYVLNTTGGGNYSTNASMDTENLTVSQSSSVVNLTINATTPQNYGIKLNATCNVLTGDNSNATLWVDGIVRTNSATLDLNASTHTMNCSYVATTNYTGSNNFSNFVINRITPAGNMVLSGTSPIVYGTASDWQGTETNTNDNDCSYNLFANNASVVNPDNSVYSTGTVNYVYNLSQCMNYTADSVNNSLVINKASSSINLTVNETQNNISISQGGQIYLNVTNKTGTGHLELYQDSVLINNGTTKISNLTTFNSLGTFNITGHQNTSTNYNESWKTWNVTVRDIILPANLNITYPINTTYKTLPTAINYTFTETAPDRAWYSLDFGKTNSSTVSAGTNFTGVSYGQGSNTTTVYVNDSSGNLANVTLTFFADSVAPTFSHVLLNRTISPTTSLDYDINATDSGIGIQTFSVNDTTNFAINSSGWLKNNTNLSVGTYNLNITVNDSLGNAVSDMMSVTISSDTTAPVVTISYPANTTYSAQVTVLNYTYVETAPDRCWYSTNNGATNSTSVSMGTNFSISSSEGSNTWITYCNDTTNNLGNASISFVQSVTTTTTTTGGGGGGGTPTPVVVTPAQFSFSTDSYSTTVSLGKIESDTITLTNGQDSQKDFMLSVETIENIIDLDENSFSLGAGESKEIKFRIIAPEKTGIYPGKIVIISKGVRKEINIVINIKTEKSLFDVTLSIPKNMRVFSAGKILISQINLLQMGIKEKVDVTMNYLIKDFEGNVLLSESETFAVTDEKSLTKEFHTEGMIPGDYVLGVELIYPEGVAVASSQFKIEEGFVFGKKEMILSTLVFVLILVSALIGFSIKKHKKMIKKLKR